MTAQIAQSSVGWPPGSSLEEVLCRIARAASRETPGKAPNPVAAEPTLSCSAVPDNAGAACALPWECPNDNRNWIASANSASRDPSLMFDRNHFMPVCTSTEASGTRFGFSGCYSITSGGSRLESLYLFVRACLSAQTLRACREGKPVAAFPGSCSTEAFI